LALSLTSTFAAFGCDSKAKIQKKTTITTPEGQTTTTDATTVEKSGKNPPAAAPVDDSICFFRFKP
jgi:hypothetical protein